MADQTLSALRELTNAVVDEFFGNDTNLSKRLIKATNEAQLLLMVQPPDDDLANHPAPAPDQVPDPTKMVAPLAEGEAWLRETGRLLSRRPDIQCRVDLRLFDRAADLLQQQAAELAMLRQQAAPVPVSERLPDTSDPSECRMPDGFCWWFDPHEDGAWYFDTYQSRYTHWLLAHLLPLPSCEAINA